jgi:hypothetical protein
MVLAHRTLTATVRTPTLVRDGVDNAPVPDNAAGVVYGIILVATLLSAESAAQETYLKTAAGVVAAIVTYWIALAYARFTGERLQHGTRAKVEDMATAALHELTVLYGAARPVPFAALIAFWIGGASLNTAIIIGVRAGLKGTALVGQAAVGAVLGSLVLVLRLLLH